MNNAEAVMALVGWERWQTARPHAQAVLGALKGDPSPLLAALAADAGARIPPELEEQLRAGFAAHSNDALVPRLQLVVRALERALAVRDEAEWQRFVERGFEGLDALLSSLAAFEAN